MLLLPAVIVAWLITSDTVPERAPTRYLAAVAVRAPAASAPNATAPSDRDACDQLSPLTLLSTGPGLEPRWQWNYTDGEPGQPLDATCLLQGRVIAP
jgi:hypothetical protein